MVCFLTEYHEKSVLRKRSLEGLRKHEARTRMKGTVTYGNLGVQRA